MRLLILTQVVDINDTSLSFFHSWIAALATQFDSIEVICLKEGEHHLPGNVRIHSLGKERGRSRIKYVARFFRYIWKLRGNYDAVFIHQNEEYALLGGWLWRLMGKRISLWRNYHSGSIFTDLASWWCAHVFCTSAYSYTAKYKKTILMPVGIDLEVFAPHPAPPDSILSFGRIAPSKRIEVFIEALGMLAKQGVMLRADIRGDALPEDEVYLKKLKEQVEALGLSSHITFAPGAPSRETPAIFNSHALFVNASPSGMYDKMIFEAGASGCLVIASSGDWTRIADKRLTFDGSAESLARTLGVLVKLPEEERGQLRDTCRSLAEEQSLTALVEKLARTL